MESIHSKHLTRFVIFSLIVLGKLATAENSVNLIASEIHESSEPQEIADTNQNDPPPPVLNNLTRCSSTELTLSKESLLYMWEMKGFLGYYVFMRKFDQVFEIKTEEVSFKSDIVDGKWFFKLTKLSASPSEDIMITTTYTYEAKQAKKLNFYIQLSLMYNEKEIVLPVQKSSNPMVMQQRLYNRRGYSSYLEYVHTLSWSLGQAVENIVKQSRIVESEPEDMADESFVADGATINSNSGNRNEDVTLRFVITAYFPSDPVYTGSENCQTFQSLVAQGLIRDGDAKNYVWKPVVPPYVKHSNSMLHDDRFADVVLKAGNQGFSAHRIILATSSPVFSAMFDNETETGILPLGNDISNSTLDSDFAPSTNLMEVNLGDISPEVVAEMLRYIYTGRVSLEKMADKMILAADKFGLPELKKICERYLYPKIRPDNAIAMYSIGHEVDSAKIKRRAFAVMKAHKSKIVTESEEFRRLAAKLPALMFELFVSS